MGLLRKLLASWKAFAHILARVQTAILLSIIYHVAIGPIGLLCRLLGRDLLGLKRVEGSSFAVELPPVTGSLERAQKQF